MRRSWSAPIYDHLGYGGAGGSRLGLIKKPEIHHGADDNGSGSTTVMELARRFGAMPDRKGRRLVFMTFSGEELGLQGSKYYCEHPLFPLEDTDAMFNLDMVGRLRPDDATKKDNILVEGAATGKNFSDLLDSLNKKYDFDLTKKTDSLPANSDHYSFYQKKIPVIFFWTGFHPDYHKPTDTADKINVVGMRKITDLSVDVIADLADGGEAAGVPDDEGRRSCGRRRRSAAGHPARLPQRRRRSPVGRIGRRRPGGEGGTENRRPHRGRRRQAGQEHHHVQEAMAAQKKGETIDVTVVRDGKKQTIKVKLDP